MFLSAAMMLEWLGNRFEANSCIEASRRLNKAIEYGFASGKIKPMEFGGPHGTAAVRDTVISLIAENVIQEQKASVQKE